MGKLILSVILLALCRTGVLAVPVNYALQLSSDGFVDCGRIMAMEEQPDYTVQLWINPQKWTNGATVLNIGSRCSLQLDSPGSLLFRCGASSLCISSDKIEVGRWSQLTILCSGGYATALVDGEECALGMIDRVPAGDSRLIIGNGFEGLIDELRLWNAAVSEEFNYYINNTINRWNPQVGALAAYYKFDQKDCSEVVEQCVVWGDTDANTNNHGLIGNTGVQRVPVCDNPMMKYRVSGAYTSNERFFDRGIARDQYLLSNDLIILGIQSFADGSAEYCTPCYHATVNNAEYLSEAHGRYGVLEFKGDATVDCGKALMNINDCEYMFEAFIFIEEWIEGAEIFSKTDTEGRGIVLYLGDSDERTVTLSVDGHKYSVAKQCDIGKWFHFAVFPAINHLDNPRYAFKFYINGVNCYPRPKDVDASIRQTPTVSGDMPLILGKGFKGMLDNVAFWKYRNFSDSEIVSHCTNGMPMPGFDKILVASTMQKAMACYLFDDADNPGFDSYSQDSWLRIMRSAYDGYDGYGIRISVKTPEGYDDSNLNSLISNAEWRKKIAEYLPSLVEPYDGVELDLEWVYSWDSYGLLADEILRNLPPDKTLTVSCHNVSYSFPRDKISQIDAFTFQQYGPQSTHFYFDTFKSYTDKFVSYGFPKEKIICSYSTTTSGGYRNGVIASPINGVRSGFLDSDFQARPDVDIKETGGITYYFTGPLQTYRRARYVVENDLGGIFYWDMGNDVATDNEYNMARWCSYALNSNVEPHVESVVVSHPASVGDIVSGMGRSGGLQCNSNIVSGCGGITVYDMAGIVVAQGENAVDISSLSKGIYVAQDCMSTVKFIK